MLGLYHFVNKTGGASEADATLLPAGSNGQAG
jgi:hypothetical protein